MLRRLLGLSLVLGMASVANAGVVISITPSTPGPYAPGSTVLMDVRLSQDPAGNAAGLRYIQFDFADSTPGLTLGALGGNPQTRRITFDASSITGGLAAYFQDRDLLNDTPPGLVSVAFTGTDFPNGRPDCPSCDNADGDPAPWNSQMFVLPGSGAYRVAGLSVTLPNDLGQYTIDPLNADDVVSGNLNRGAAVSWGFGADRYNNVGGPGTAADGLVDPGDEIVQLQPTATAGAGGLGFDGIGTFFPSTTGGGFEYGIPEPATLALLAIGGLAALRRRNA